MIYFELFIVFVQIGLFSIGGGYASLPHLQHLVVNQYHWLDLTTYTDLLALSQMTPGPISINTASFVGMKMGGVLGSVVATFAMCFPSLIIVLCLAYLYVKYKNLEYIQIFMTAVRPIVVALIISFAYDLVKETVVAHSNSFLQVVLLISCLVLLKKFKLSPLLLVLLMGVLSVVLKLIINFL